MTQFIHVQLTTTALWQPPHRSIGNACLIGEGGSSVENTIFWLTRPDGAQYNMITAGSELKEAVDMHFKQRNSQNVLCIAPSRNAFRVTGETPRPIPNGTVRNFYLPASPVQSIESVILYTGGTYYDLPAGGWTYTPTQVAGQYTGGFALNQIPPRGSRLFVDYNVDPIPGALKASMSYDVQLIALCNNTTLTELQQLADHCDLAFRSTRFRMGTAMLPEGQTLVGEYRDWPNQLSSDNMMLIAHNSGDDVAAAWNGMLSGTRVHDDPILSNVIIDRNNDFSDNDVIQFDNSQVVALGKQYSNELGTRAFESYTLSPVSSRRYIDTVRTYQDIIWRLISTLDSPNVIGKVSYTKAGMSLLKSYIRAAYQTPIDIGEIVGLRGIEIPIERIIRTPWGSRNSVQQLQLQAAKANRILENISVTYEQHAYPHHFYISLEVL